MEVTEELFTYVIVTKMVPSMIYKQNETPLLVASKVTSEVKEEVAEELKLLSLPTG